MPARGSGSWPVTSTEQARGRGHGSLPTSRGTAQLLDILHDPTACDFDPGTLACSPERNPGGAACLAPEKVAAIREVYVSGDALDTRAYACR